MVSNGAGSQVEWVCYDPTTKTAPNCKKDTRQIPIMISSLPASTGTIDEILDQFGVCITADPKHLYNETQYDGLF